MASTDYALLIGTVKWELCSRMATNYIGIGWNHISSFLLKGSQVCKYCGNKRYRYGDKPSSECPDVM